MATATPRARPSWFVVAAVLATVWNAFGVFMYLSTVGIFGDPTAGLSDAERALASSTPAWIIGAFAIGTLAGLIGSAGLLLGRAWAQPVLIVSLVALLVLEGWALFLMSAPDGLAL